MKTKAGEIGMSPAWANPDFGRTLGEETKREESWGSLSQMHSVSALPYDTVTK